jgi:Tat protein secretion system quality control protein TatD with DNase activity
MLHTVQMLAELHGTTAKNMAQLTAENAARLFSIEL